MRNRGVSYGILGIIALLGVLGIAIWTSYQLSVGPGYEMGITERAAQDQAIAKMENTKVLVEQALEFGTLSSSLDVAGQGGTREAATYWYCSGVPTPPEFDEVSFALSNKSLSYLNGYIVTLNEKEDFRNLGIFVSKYDCVGIYPPTKSVCLTQDCEYFDSGVTGGVIDVSDPAKVTYSGSVDTGNGPERFWMVYYRLYNFFKNNQIMAIIADSIRGQCPGPEPMHEKALVAFEDVCDEIEKLLDPQYVTCKVEILCEPDDLSCLNAPCQRFFDEQLCYSAAFLEGERESYSKISLQAQTGTERIKFVIDDYKFKPLGDKHMRWNLYAVIPIFEQECIPID